MTSDELYIEYEYSEKPDMVITNWDSSKGNYIFYNQGITGEEPAKAIPEKPYLSISPNPVNDLLTIQINAQNAENISIALYDLTGQECFYRHNHFLRKGQNLFDISVDEMAPGT